MESNTSFPPNPELRRCKQCHASYPLSNFGYSKAGPKGFNKVCKECRSEYNAAKWEKSFGRKKPRENVGPIRCVLWHNRKILESALATTKMELRGFDCRTKVEYKIYYGPSERLGLNAFTLFTRNGEVFIEWALAGIKDPKEALIAYLRHHQIRLELSDLDVITSKTLIYYV